MKYKGRKKYIKRNKTLDNETYISSHICRSPDAFVAIKVHLRAFMASRKTSHKFCQASRLA